MRAAGDGERRADGTMDRFQVRIGPSRSSRSSVGTIRAAAGWPGSARCTSRSSDSACGVSPFARPTRRPRSAPLPLPPRPDAARATGLRASNPARSCGSRSPRIRPGHREGRGGPCHPRGTRPVPGPARPAQSRAARHRSAGASTIQAVPRFVRIALILICGTFLHSLWPGGRQLSDAPRYLSKNHRRTSRHSSRSGTVWHNIDRFPESRNAPIL